MEVEDLMDAIEEMDLRFARPAQIMKSLKTVHGIDLPRRTLNDYLVRIVERRRARPRANIVDLRLAAEDRMMAYLRQAASGSVADKMRIEDHLSKLQGTQAPKVVHLAGAGGGPIEVKTVLTSDEKRARAAALIAAAQARGAGKKDDPGDAD